MASTIEYRTCPFCEATCGLELHLNANKVTLVRGDRDDVFSQGFLCPKGTAFGHLEDDPDRLRTPQIRDRATGQWRSVDWPEAFAAIEKGLAPILADGDRNAVAMYLGNPNVHSLSMLIYNRVLIKGLGSENIYSASTVDQVPKQVSSGLLFGSSLTVPIPDVDRTDYLLILGANPFVSNGSLCTAPDLPGRLRALIKRGGQMVVVDPRRTKTAEEASEHLFIRPGTDAYFLFALVNVLFAENLVNLGRLSDHSIGLDEVRSLAAEFTPEAVEEICRIDAETISRVARELSRAERAAVYARIGTCVQEFGTLASWLVDVINVLTGNLDREGGAMFPNPAAGGSRSDAKSGPGRGVSFGRRQSRVRGCPEIYGEFPVACLAEEITTPGSGQVRALITVAGNPAVSTPDSDVLNQALASLDFMVSVDIYRNETTRHADVILPAPSLLARSHYDIAFYQLSIRNIANYSPALVPLADHEMPEWEVLLRLGAIVSGLGSEVDPAALDDALATMFIERSIQRADSPISHLTVEEVLQHLGQRRGPDRILDLMLRTGPYGDVFTGDGGLTLDQLEDNPHGIDFGPLQPRVPEVLRTPSGKIELAPEPIVADVGRLSSALSQYKNDELVLIGRRDLRSNNSWMHNIKILVKGKDRCTLQMHPEDATRIGIQSGQVVRVISRVGELEVAAEVTDSLMPGVVSLPHGWGHSGDETQMAVAESRAGVNSNILTDGSLLDPLSGNAVLNGIPVEVSLVS